MSVINASLYFASAYYLTRWFVPSSNTKITAVVLTALHASRYFLISKLQDTPKLQGDSADPIANTNKVQLSLLNSRLMLCTNLVHAACTLTTVFLITLFPKIAGSPFNACCIEEVSLFLINMSKGIYKIRFSKSHVSWGKLYNILMSNRVSDDASFYHFYNLLSIIFKTSFDLISFYVVTKLSFKSSNPSTSFLVVLISLLGRNFIMDFTGFQSTKLRDRCTDDKEKDTIKNLVIFILCSEMLFFALVNYRLAQRYFPNIPPFSILGLIDVAGLISRIFCTAGSLMVYQITPRLYIRFWIS